MSDSLRKSKETKKQKQPKQLGPGSDYYGNSKFEETAGQMLLNNITYSSKDVPKGQVTQGLDTVVKDLAMHGYLHPSKTYMLNTPETQRQINRLVERITTGQINFTNYKNDKIPVIPTIPTSYNSRVTSAETMLGHQFISDNASSSVSQSDSSDAQLAVAIKNASGKVKKLKTKIARSKAATVRSEDVEQLDNNNSPHPSGIESTMNHGKDKKNATTKKLKTKAKRLQPLNAVNVDSNNVSYPVAIEEGLTGQSKGIAAKKKRKTKPKNLQTQDNEPAQTSSAMDGVGIDVTSGITIQRPNSAVPKVSKIKNKPKDSLEENEEVPKPIRLKRPKKKALAEAADIEASLLNLMESDKRPASAGKSKRAIRPRKIPIIEDLELDHNGMKFQDKKSLQTPSTSEQNPEIATKGLKESLDEADSIVVGNLAQLQDFALLENFAELQEEQPSSSLKLQLQSQKQHFASKAKKYGSSQQVAAQMMSLAQQMFQTEVNLPGFLNEHISLDLVGHTLVVIAYRPKDIARKLHARKITEIVDIPKTVQLENLKVGRSPDGKIWIEEWIIDPEEQIQNELNSYLSNYYTNDQESIAAAIVQGVQHGYGAHLGGRGTKSTKR